jgi:cell division septation protein DedD
MSDQQQESQDTEVTLGVGKLLGLFFLLVVLCGVFFSLGYSLGKGSQKSEGSLVGNDRTPAATVDSKSAASFKDADSDRKPDKLAEQKDASAEPPKSDESTDSKQSQPELKATPGGAFVVQVAAVSKKEDAEALQQALQRKQYPVVVTPGAADKLFHVQIGPFAELKDAETMKGRLASDGYNAIVKK